jgi:hypothetical protein
MELVWFGFLLAIGMTVASILFTLVIWAIAAIFAGVAWVWEKLQ